MIGKTRYISHMGLANVQISLCFLIQIGSAENLEYSHANMTGPKVHLGNDHYLSAGLPHQPPPLPLLINNDHSLIMK